MDKMNFLIMLHICSFIFCGITGTFAQNKSLIKESEVKEWVNYLASDQMKGRRNGSIEMKTAAFWLASEFKSSGLKPVLASGEYIQEYSYKMRSSEINERNVLGMIEGSDPELRKEYVVISAHFDHIGTGRIDGDSIFNGADDNSSGTATLIGIAEFIRRSGKKPGRTIVFAAFSGEENGMRGSREFVSKSIIEPENIYVNMNIEMIGHSMELGKGKYYMTGCHLSDLDDQIKHYFDNPDFKLIDTIPITNMLFNMSDNISFSRLNVKDGITIGVPSGTFATSTMRDYLHQPSDETELFDFSNMTSLVNHFGEVAIWLSENRKKINWTNEKMRRPGGQ